MFDMIKYIWLIIPEIMSNLTSLLKTYSENQQGKRDASLASSSIDMVFCTNIYD